MPPWKRYSVSSRVPPPAIVAWRARRAATAASVAASDCTELELAAAAEQLEVEDLGLHLGQARMPGAAEPALRAVGDVVRVEVARDRGGAFPGEDRAPGVVDGGLDQRRDLGRDEELGPAGGAEALGEVAGDAGEDLHVGGDALHLGAAEVAGAAGAGQRRLAAFGERLEPVGDVEGGVAVAGLAGEQQLGIFAGGGEERGVEGRRVAEADGAFHVGAVGAAAGALDEPEVGVDLGPVVVVRGRGAVRRG